MLIPTQKPVTLYELELLLADPPPKSDVMRQAAKELGIPLIDLRLSRKQPKS